MTIQRIARLVYPVAEVATVLAVLLYVAAAWTIQLNTPKVPIEATGQIHPWAPQGRGGLPSTHYLRASELHQVRAVEIVCVVCVVAVAVTYRRRTPR